MDSDLFNEIMLGFVDAGKGLLFILLLVWWEYYLFINLLNYNIYFTTWVPTNISRSFGERSNPIWWTSSSESGLGNTDSCQSSSESTSPPDPIKPENSASRPRKDTSSTEWESEEEEERDQFPRVSSPESQLQLVSISWSPPETSDQRPRRESVELWEPLECWTHIGLLKTEPTNIMRSS